MTYATSVTACSLQTKKSILFEKKKYYFTNNGSFRSTQNIKSIRHQKEIRKLSSNKFLLDNYG